MGPPQSPKEIRRSGRRQGPSGSASTSKSPDSDQPPKPKDTSARPALSTSTSSSRGKRLKQEDLDDAEDEPRSNTAPSVTSSSSTQGASNGKPKRKGKDKEKNAIEEEQPEDDADPVPEDSEPAGGDEEEQGITRCVCGSSEDDPDAGEFMIQCESCKVWQHGPCMGFMTEDQVDEGDYYCEQCKPEAHVDLLRRLSSRKGRHAHGSTASRVSRSRSPSQLKQQSKRRNTMNSRDFDESLKEIMEATAAEAAGKDSVSAKEDTVSAPVVDHDEGQVNGKKKRKRIEDELPSSKKRTRSASTASERPASTLPRDETPVSSTAKPAPPAATTSKSNGRNKRGGRKAVVTDTAPVGDVDEATPTAPTTATTNKRQGNASRKGGSGGPKRPPLSHAVSHTGSATPQEPSASRARNPAGLNQHSAANAEARAYRNTHAYAVSQQPLHTSWGTPDYLAHLQHILPTEVPQPLEVRTSFAEGSEVTLERGVKIKWPGKRMSVGDMNKRVRALVEWVGREQIIASDRERRRRALEKELSEAPPLAASANTVADEDGDVVMALDGPVPSRPFAETTSTSHKMLTDTSTVSSGTMRTMEELMEELISFQERFGPGAKARDRERRQHASS